VTADPGGSPAIPEAEARCGRCDLVAGITLSPGGVIYETRDWLVAHARPVVRGATMVYARRHVEQVADLSSAEMASAGEVLRVVMRAMREALEPERIYLFYFGEWTPHTCISR
jgi:diadenosine tetraphosphate (Ap4A) HIT family hydrolase